MYKGGGAILEEYHNKCKSLYMIMNLSFVHDCVIYNNTNPFWFKKEDYWGPESHIISTLYKNIPYPLFSKFLSYGI